MNNKTLIAVTSEGAKLASIVAEKFGKTPYIIIYDAEKVKFESFRNPYSKLLGGAGIQTSQLIIGKNAGALITCEIGTNSLRLLQAADIGVFLCEKKSVEEVVNEYIEGKLRECRTAVKINISRGRHRGNGWRRNHNL